VNALAKVARLLRERGTPFALIGAAALAVHGVSRATQDLDLLVCDRACLDPAYWDRVRVTGLEVTVREGDADDPLAGIVSVTAGGALLDVVVGRHWWQAAILGRALGAEIEGVTVPVAAPSDLILLKLYAAGSQDAWDIAQLVAGPERQTLIQEVESKLFPLPEDSQRLWRRLVTERAPGGSR
jgi:predicted nucleotidyltransferase